MRTDLAVVGGGAIGAAVAYFVRLVDPSVDVTVVERDPTYTMASTPRASGGVRRLFSLPENIELSNFSIPFFEQFAQTMAVDGEPAEIGFKKNGYLFIVPPAGLEVLKRNFETQQSMGCNVIWLEPDALQEQFPSMTVSDLGAGVHSPDDGWLDPHSVLMGFRRKAAAMGAQFVADEVTGLEWSGNVVLSAKLGPGEQVEAEHFVNAAGAWAKNICEMVDVDVPIEPLRR